MERVPTCPAINTKEVVTGFSKQGFELVHCSAWLQNHFSGWPMSPRRKRTIPDLKTLLAFVQCTDNITVFVRFLHGLRRLW